MDEHAVGVVLVEGIAADVRTLVDDENVPAGGGEALRDDTA
jgi:hypothetical protein